MAKPKKNAMDFDTWIAGVSSEVASDVDAEAYRPHYDAGLSPIEAVIKDREDDGLTEDLPLVPGVTIGGGEKPMFIIDVGGGFSTRGFESLYAEAKQLAEVLGLPDLAPKKSEIGTLKQYAEHSLLISQIGNRDLGTWFNPATLPKVKAILEDARLSHRRLIITMGNSETGKAWDKPESGTIGRSMGPLKIPLPIKTSRSTGGGGLLEHCIVRIQDAASKVDLYRHPTFVPHVEPAKRKAAAPAA